ncbi:hypothetical protein ACKWRH_45770 (plasmid) [Bradyrhizobium sp. Pa8]|uniref:hypothetical protein n=1 Tax=Bradyrhizobium sp. Pa8 TaxID=3386552 RepID=UPI00403F1D86
MQRLTLAKGAAMPTVMSRDRPVPPAGMTQGRKCSDIARFSLTFEKANREVCEASESAPGCREFDNDRHDPAESERATYSSFLSASLAGATPDPVKDSQVIETRSPSVTLVALAETIADRLWSGRDYVEDTAVQIMLNREPFGNARVAISGRNDTLTVRIESEYLWPILQLQGQAFARDLSDRIGMRIVMLVIAHSSACGGRDSSRRSRRLEPILYYIAEKIA